MIATKELAKFTAAQVRRMSGADFFHAQSIEALAEIERVLIQHADSEQHMERIVTLWINLTRKMLHPSDVPGLARETRKVAALPEGCSKCNGAVWVQVEIVLNGEIVTAMGRCSCPRGLILRDSDSERRKQGYKPDPLAYLTSTEPVEEFIEEKPAPLVAKDPEIREEIAAVVKRKTLQ